MDIESKKTWQDIIFMVIILFVIAAFFIGGCAKGNKPEPCNWICVGREIPENCICENEILDVPKAKKNSK